MLLKQGRIIACWLCTCAGMVAQGEEAVQRLLPVKGWLVEEEVGTTREALAGERRPAASVPALPLPAPNVLDAAPVPRKRVAALPEALMQTLPARERVVVRTVFAFIDGARTVSDLCEYLPHLERATLTSALGTLHRWSMIEL